MEMQRVLELAYEKAVDNYNRAHVAYLDYPHPIILEHLNIASKELDELAELLHKK